MDILGRDPLSVLNAMGGVAQDAWNYDLVLPYQERVKRYARGQLREANAFLNPPMPPGAEQGMVTPIGPTSPIARMLGLNNALKFVEGGSNYRLAPTRSIEEQMRIAEQKRLYREASRGMRGLPVEDWRQSAFREYLFKQSPKLERITGPRHTTDELGTLEDLEALLPGDLSEELLQTMSPDFFRRFLHETLTQASNARIAGRKGLNPDDLADAHVRQGELIAQNAQEADLSGDFRRAAKLAALHFRFNRTPKNMFEQKYGRYAERISDKPKSEFRTEGASWAELKDKALKNAFRMRMQKVRKRGGGRMHG